MSEKIISTFDSTIKKIDIRLRNEDFKDPDQTERNINDMKTILDVVKKCLTDLEKLLPSTRGQEQNNLSCKLTLLRDQYDSRRKDIFKVEEKFLNQQKVKNLLNPNSNAKGGEASKATRNAILDLHKKTDYQGDLIDDIGKDLIETNRNLDNINLEVKKQGEQIVRVHGQVLQTGASVKRADKTIGVMSRRNSCHKLLLHILAVLLFVSIVTVFIIKRI